MTVEPRLEEERNVEYEQPRPLAGAVPPDPLLAEGEDLGVDQALEGAEGGLVGEHARGDRRAVGGTRRQHEALPQPAGQTAVAGGGFEDPVREGVRLHDLAAGDPRDAPTHVGLAGADCA